jgi:hypothetical protein
MCSTVWQNDGNIEHIHGLAWKERARCSDRLCFVKVFNIVIEQVLLFC